MPTYAIDFSKGKLVPLATSGLAVGQIVMHRSRWGDKAYVVTEATAREYSFGQRCLCLEDGHSSTVSGTDLEPADYSHCGWRMGERIMPADELAAAIAAGTATKARFDAEKKLAEEAKAKASAIEREKLIADHPHLLRVEKGGYASAAHGAKNIRIELKRAFPGIKFRVVSDTFSGGDSIDVSWTLGPKTEDVEHICAPYKEGHFNGMEDIYETNMDNQWPDLFGGAKYIHCQRDIERDQLESAGAALKNLHAYEDPYQHLSDARSIILQRAYPPGTAITGIERNPNTECGRMEEFYRATFTGLCVVGRASSPPAHDPVQSVITKPADSAVRAPEAKPIDLSKFNLIS